ncbi:MAG: flavodoxin, partial [Clostridia bacterium]|nr:flavodoxin [Clostridia bacterium]
AKARPELKRYLEEISAYDNIFVCGPCWWGTFPMAVLSQLDRLDFTGKKVFAVMTHEGSGLGGSERTLRDVCKGATIGRGLAVHGAEAALSEATVAAWAKKSV